MGIRTIPKSHEYICDTCGNCHRQENADGYYTNSTPPKWSTVKIFDDNGGTSRLICPDCSGLINVIRNWRGHSK